MIWPQNDRGQPPLGFNSKYITFKATFQNRRFLDFITNVIFQKSRDFRKIELLNFCVQLLIFSIQGQAENYR